MMGTAKRDSANTARKRHAKNAGANLFPEMKPDEGQTVLAFKGNRVGSQWFMAEYRSTSPSGIDGAFYSNSTGTYSMLEGTVDCWLEIPGE